MIKFDFYFSEKPDVEVLEWGQNVDFLFEKYGEFDLILAAEVM